MARPKQDSSIMLPNGRKRTISPGFFNDADVVSLAPMDRLLFIGIWCYADKAGRLLDKPIDLKMKLFPADAYDVDAGLGRLAERRLIHRYRVGRPQLRVLAMKEDKWTEIQRIHPNEPESALPPPPSKSPQKPRSTPPSLGPGTYAPVLDHQNGASDPILSPGSSGPSGPSGPTGSSGPSDPPADADRRNLSAEEELWLELEACRIARCEELQIAPGKSKRPPAKVVNAMLLRAVEHCGYVDRETAHGPLSRWDQLGDLYEEGYLSAEYGRDKKPPYPIELFCSHGVLDKAMQQQAKRATEQPTSEAAA